jgi:hypothetical protein
LTFHNGIPYPAEKKINHDKTLGKAIRLRA